MINQMDKLSKLLDEHEIPYVREVNGVGNDHLCYPVFGEGRICSVICGKYTYGGEEGLLEIMGLLTPEEEEFDDVLGYLTADQVFKRIKNHWESTRK